MTSPFAKAADTLASTDLTAHAGIVGFDGFVDQIIRVVQAKRGPGDADYFPDIATLAARIAAAAGKSTALELHIEVTKLGGNGPIMANAMAAHGLPITYIGAVGTGKDNPALHPVFQPMADRSEVISVCEAAKTDALEFHDGKLMLQQMECLDNLDFDVIETAVGPERLRSLFAAADFVAMNHWSSLPHMTAIWKRLQQEVCPGLPARRRVLFADLADTQKRSTADLKEAFATLAGFNPWYETTLGLNEGESEHVCQIYDCEPSTKAPHAKMQARADAIRKATGISCVTVHPTAFAAAASAAGTAVVEGPYTRTPKISTGAGDHFNAGFALGRLLDLDLDESLALGVCTSGHYVRTAESPTAETLVTFLRAQG